MKPHRNNTILVAIDFQEKLVPAMGNADELIEASQKLFKGLAVLGVPTLVTQQYTKGLGPTVGGIADAIGSFGPIEKISFSAFGADGFESALKSAGRKNIILCGIEAHICVLQTALEMREKGYNVYVPADCISSRKPIDLKMAVSRMEQSGCVLTTCEALLYELLGSSKADGFREISAIIK